MFGDVWRCLALGLRTILQPVVLGRRGLDCSKAWSVAGITNCRQPRLRLFILNPAMVVWLHFHAYDCDIPCGIPSFLYVALSARSLHAKKFICMNAVRLRPRPLLQAPLVQLSGLPQDSANSARSFAALAALHVALMEAAGNSALGG